LALAALCVCGPASVDAAKPAVELPQSTPSITASAPPFNASFVAGNVLDQNSLTEYASQSQGVDTFIDFDFGAPVPITHFHHLNRSAADEIDASQLIFSNDPTFATGNTVVPIAHASQTAAINYAVGSQSARYVRWDVTGISGAATNQGAREIAFLNLTGSYSQIADPAITASAPQHSAPYPSRQPSRNSDRLAGQRPAGVPRSVESAPKWPEMKGIPGQERQAILPLDSVTRRLSQKHAAAWSFGWRAPRRSSCPMRGYSFRPFSTRGTIP
jgi:hypothetical protein